MPSSPKMWLVRTRSGSILGPYTESQLIDQHGAGNFSPDDEIAPSHGHWVSAQKLVHREDTEFTRTSTRSLTVTTKSISIHPAAQGSAARKMPEGASKDPSAPTPVQPGYPPVPGAPTPTHPQNQRPLIILVMLSLCVSVAILLKIIMGGNRVTPETVQTIPVPTVAEDSPFIRKIDSLIRAGQPQTALRKLTQYHQNASKYDLAYRIPYAALLITEGVSNQRAKRVLDQVITSATASSLLKSEAHRWLGYRKLSLDEDDRGISHFLEALQLNPKDTSAKFNLGRAYLSQRRPKEALEYFKLAELESPDLWLIHIYKGHTKVELEKNEDARYNLQRATEISSERWLTYVYYGLFLAGNATQEKSAAQAQMRKMLTRDPYYEIDSPAPFGYYFVDEKYSDYLAAFLKIMQGPEVRKLRELGKLYINYLRNGPKSVEGKRITRLARSGGIMTRVIALKIALDNKLTGRSLEQAVARLPANLEEFGYYAYVLRGDAHMRLGNMTAAAEDLKRARLLGPKTAVSRYMYAKWLQQKGDISEARSEIKSLLIYHPHYIPAILALQKF